MADGLSGGPRDGRGGGKCLVVVADKAGPATMNASSPRPYAGIPYVLGGSSFDGVDCYGLVRLVFAQDLNITIRALPDPGSPREREAAILAARHLWRRVDEPLAYDVVRLRRHGWPQHLGIVQEGRRILHADEHVGHVISESMEGPIRHAIVDFWRLRFLT